MDNFNRYVQGFLAVVTTLGFFAVLAALMQMSELNPAIKDILLVMLGALLANYKEITSYFFGSSSGSAKKDDQNAALTAHLTGTPTHALAAGATAKVKIDDSVPVKVEETKP